MSKRKKSELPEVVEMVLCLKYKDDSMDPASNDVEATKIYQNYAEALLCTQGNGYQIHWW